MRAYVITTAVAFTLLTLAHVWRAVVEGWGVAKDPWFVLSTLVATSLAIWAWRIVATLRRSSTAAAYPDDTRAQRRPIRAGDGTRYATCPSAGAP